MTKQLAHLIDSSSLLDVQDWLNKAIDGDAKTELMM
tara:strand:+ start:811 stop:918 length:108 start_codon:yes stop_codon:yes gene_type:complete